MPRPADLAAGLAALDATSRRRRRPLVTTPQGPHLTVDGRDYLAFASNDYLGLASHPALVAALQDGAARFGAGAGASHLVSGHLAPHDAAETALAAFLGREAALLFSSGYQANVGVIGALVGIGMKFASALRQGGVVPFGPFLAMGGITAMLFGPQSILRAIGL